MWPCRTLLLLHIFNNANILKQKKHLLNKGHLLQQILFNCKDAYAYMSHHIFTYSYYIIYMHTYHYVH